MSEGKKVFFRGRVFYVDERVYNPAEDTFLLAENLEVEENDFVLDMGTGCGIIAILAAEKARRVVAVDINPYAVEVAERNARINGVAAKIDFRLGDLFQPIRGEEKFSLITFNAPYLPSEPEEEKTWIGRAWAGGPTGRSVINRFIEQAPAHLTVNGRILLVQSSLSNINETLKMLKVKGFKAEITAELKISFEKIVVVKAERL